MKNKMLLEILLLIALIAVLVFFVLNPAKIMAPNVVQQNKLSSVCFGKNCFQVELAITEARRETGLMNRKELDKDNGMLFVFDKEGIYPFWMKNTLIPLDMIWTDISGKVVFISQNVQPCKTLICPTVIPLAKAKYVLEVNAGICQSIGLKVGDVMSITY